MTLPAASRISCPPDEPVATAALVHVQKNEDAVVWPMLKEAVNRLENQPAVYLGLDVRRLVRELKKIIATKTLYFLSI